MKLLNFYDYKRRTYILLIFMMISYLLISNISIAWEFGGGSDSSGRDIGSLGVNTSELIVGSDSTSDSFLHIVVSGTEGFATLTTLPMSYVGDITPVATGNLISEGASSVTELGFVWNTAGAPKTTDNYTSITEDIELGYYYADIEGLSYNTLYFLRAFAENDEGVYYANQIAFVTTPNISGSYSSVADIEFEPTQITGTPTYTIADQTVEGNNVIYALVDASGVTVWTSSLSSSGGFYYGTDEDDQRFNPPTSARMTQSGDVNEDSPLPFYELFVEAGADSGIAPALLYVIAHVAFVVFFGVLAYVFTGSVLVTIFVTIILHAGFMSTGILPMWFLIFFAFLALSILYISRRV